MIRFEQVIDGMEHGDIAVVDSPNDDGAVCKIGENWFYFGGQEAEEMTAAEYLANVPKDEIAKEILGALEDFRHDPGFADEYGYYEAFLHERAAERDAVQGGERPGASAETRHRQNHRHKQPSR